MNVGAVWNLTAMEFWVGSESGIHGARRHVSRASNTAMARPSRAYR